jgi:hypothetical protein
MSKKFVALFSLALVAVVAVGCGKSNKPSDMGELGGCVVKVTQDGAPLEGADVIFYAQDPENQKYTPSGRTNEKGEAKIKTYGFEGVPAGEYKVTVTKLVIEEGTLVVEENGAESVERGAEYQVVAAEYRDVNTTPLTVTVTDPMKEVPVFDVGAAVEDDHKE